MQCDSVAVMGTLEKRNSILLAGKAVDHMVLIAGVVQDAEEWFQQQYVQAQERVVSKNRDCRLPRLWLKPKEGTLKCNLNASWVNDSSFYGGAWLVRNNTCEMLFHARDACLSVVNQIAAELQCVV
ncbi:uncharacterized protein LOC17890772 [Capsella rubella]|nr:uncharacterized protein LOC17890772 [Capsella rubella]